MQDLNGNGVCHIIAIVQSFVGTIFHIKLGEPWKTSDNSHNSQPITKTKQTRMSAFLIWWDHGCSARADLLFFIFYIWFCNRSMNEAKCQILITCQSKQYIKNIFKHIHYKYYLCCLIRASIHWALHFLYLGSIATSIRNHFKLYIFPFSNSKSYLGGIFFIWFLFSKILSSLDARLQVMFAIKLPFCTHCSECEAYIDGRLLIMIALIYVWNMRTVKFLTAIFETKTNHVNENRICCSCCCCHLILKFRSRHQSGFIPSLVERACVCGSIATRR